MKVALLELLLIVNEVGLNVTVPDDELDSVTVRAASVVFGFLYWSWRCTVMLPDATPAVVVTAVEVNARLVAAPADTVKLRSPEPPVELLVELPSVTCSEAVCALCATRGAVATPLAKVMEVAVPRLVPLTVARELSGPAAKPLKVRLVVPL